MFRNLRGAQKCGLWMKPPPSAHTEALCQPTPPAHSIRPHQSNWWTPPPPPKLAQNKSAHTKLKKKTRKRTEPHPSQPKTAIRAFGEAKCQMPAPKAMMPAGGTLKMGPSSRWHTRGHPGPRNFQTRPPPSQPSGCTTNAPTHTWRIPSSKGEQIRTPVSTSWHTHSAFMASPPPCLIPVSVCVEGGGGIPLPLSRKMGTPHFYHPQKLPTALGVTYHTPATPVIPGRGSPGQKWSKACSFSKVAGSRWRWSQRRL